jgi:hypothetical protein
LAKPKDPIHVEDLEESKTSNAKGRSKQPTRKGKLASAVTQDKVATRVKVNHPASSFTVTGKRVRRDQDEEDVSSSISDEEEAGGQVHRTKDYVKLMIKPVAGIL